MKTFTVDRRKFERQKSERLLNIFLDIVVQKTMFLFPVLYS